MRAKNLGDLKMSELTLKDIRRINKEFRLKDDSHLYPIRGGFNATERAIRRLRKYQRKAIVTGKQIGRAHV